MVKIDHGVRYQGRPSAQEMQRRYTLAMDLMREHRIDCLVMQANDGMLCQYVRWFCEVRTAHYCYVLFDKDGNLSMISHGPEGGKALGPMYGIELANNIAVPVVNNACYGDGTAAEQAAGIIKKAGHKRLGMVGLNLITTAFYQNLLAGVPGAEPVDFTDRLDPLIAVKSPEELDMLRQALELHETAADAAPSMLYAGRLEREFCADMYRLSILLGADEYLANIMICSSPLPGPMFPVHYLNKVIAEGDTLNMLFEVPAMTGYYADFHRYWAVGKVAAEVGEAIAAAAEAQDYLAGLCRPGISGRELFELCNDWLERHGFAREKRMHGHGQGYGLVERPYIDAGDPMVLRENMYLAIHPTIQCGGVSVAPGDNYIITADGAQRLNRFPRELVVV